MKLIRFHCHAVWSHQAIDSAPSSSHSLLRLMRAFQMFWEARSVGAWSSYCGEGLLHAGIRDAYLLYSCNRILLAHLQTL